MILKTQNVNFHYVAGFPDCITNVLGVLQGPIFRLVCPPTLYGLFGRFFRLQDSKEKFLIAWQQKYNEVAEDIVNDKKTNTEMHTQNKRVTVIGFRIHVFGVPNDHVWALFQTFLVN